MRMGEKPERSKATVRIVSTKKKESRTKEEIKPEERQKQQAEATTTNC